MKKHVLIYTDFGDTTDGLARVFGVFDTFKEAQTAMQKDVETYKADNPDIEDEANDDNYYVLGDTYYGCQWQILTVDL